MDQWEATRRKWLRTARYVDANYQSPFSVDGRPISNVEMMSDQITETIRAREKIARDGCCGGDWWPDGICRVPGIGLCPHVQKAMELMKNGE